MKEIRSANNWHEFESSLSHLGKTEKGRAFEELTRLYLKTDPVFSTKIEEVWHHSDVPQSIIDDLRLQKPEIGVDLIAQVKDGTFWAIQCKFHQDRTKNVSYEELSTFFSITERDQTFPKLSHRLVCTSADGVSHRVGKAHPYKLGYLTSFGFSSLGRKEFDVFRKALDGHISHPEPYTPRAHQRRAIGRAKSYFADYENSRGKIIHPCGSGKSLTGYWVAQSLNANTILIAVPSIALVRQTLNVWTREAVANGLNMDWIAVCSDEEVSKSTDPAIHAADLGIEVDTDPEVVAEFLSRSFDGIKVLITTYQSGHAASEGAKKAGIGFDLGIYDEAHKTVGRRDKTFAYLLHDENIEVRKRVFMTATEREFKGNSDDILSMDDEDVYGSVIDHLSFKGALEQDPPILSDYKIVTTIFTKGEIEGLIERGQIVKSDGQSWSLESDAQTLASLITISKLISERQIKHIVSFHSSIARSKEFMELNAKAAEVGENFVKLTAFHVSGKDSIGRRAAQLERFVEAEPSLMTNARCLNEGVDVPAIDAVLFADPKQSKVDIVQAAGRALRKFKGKELGYIVIPVVIEDANGSQVDSAFNQIINVVAALGMSDERIIEEFRLLISGKQRRGNFIEIEAPTDMTAIDFQDFLSNIQIRVWDRLSFAKSVVGESEFARWMKKSTSLSEKSIKNYTNAVRKISNDLVRKKLAYSSLEEILVSEDLDRLKKEYFDIPEYKELDVRGKGMYSAGFNKLVEFQRSRI